MYQFSPSLIKPPRWNVQPHLTAAPELWRNCLSFVPFWEGAGLPYDVQRGLQGSVVGEGFDQRPNWFAATFGLRAKSAKTNDSEGEAFRFPALDLTSVSRLALVAYGKIDLSESGEIARIFSIEHGGGDDFRIFKFNADLAAEFDDGSTTTRLKDTKPTEEPQLYVLQIDNTTGVQEFWTRGGLRDSSTGESDVDFAGPDGRIFLGSNSGLDSFTVFEFGWAGVFADFFSPTAINRLIADPFAMLRPGPQLLPLLFGGAGTTGSTVTDTALITSATSSPLTASERTTASDTAAATSTAATPLTAVETAIANDAAQITATFATPLTATTTASATDTAQITSATVTTLTASETTSSAVTDTAVITSAAATPLTAQETAIANDTAQITSAVVTTLVASTNTGDLFAATASARLVLPAPESRSLTIPGNLAKLTIPAGSTKITLPAPASRSLTIPGNLAKLTIPAGSTKITLPAPASQSLVMPAPGSTKLTLSAE